MEPSRKGTWLRGWFHAAFACDVRSLAVYRMALGGILCTDCLLRMRDFGLMFGIAGIFPPDVVRRTYADPTLWSVALWHDADWWQAAVLALEGVAGLMLAAGVATRLATLAAWIAVWSVIRRSGLASCGGDVWLACQLLWSLFLPLGAVWSFDSWRRRARGGQPPRGVACSVATAALVLQLLTVYVSAGVAKCNASWLSGNAVAHALSVHDHGTSLGMALARSGLVGDVVSWAVVAFEIVAPLVLLVRPGAGVRGGLVAAFLVFHVLIGLTMTVGLFVPIGMAAWLPLIPSVAWDRAGQRGAPPVIDRLSRPAAWCCGTALTLAVVSLVAYRCGPLRLPRPLTAVLNLAGLHQDWQMFGTVPAQEQWVYARAGLADGRVVDLLRDGRPCDGARPEGGFTSLRDNRWHNVCWCVVAPAQAHVAAAVAAGLARHWNATHGPEARVRWVEIRHAKRETTGPGGLEYETLVATWPPRDPAGRGNLDRLLDTAAVVDAVDSP